MQTNTIDL